jgi:hypothetical protein
VAARKDLRKTARGASSPANPALHIPELHNPSAKSALYSTLIESGGYRSKSTPTATPLPDSSLTVESARAYPLSMTRAATSSVDSKMH